MVLDNTVDFKRAGGTTKTLEGKVRPGEEVTFLSGIACNLQFDDGYTKFTEYGKTASDEDCFLYVKDRAAIDVKKENVAIVDGVRYDVKKNIKYSNHFEIILRESVK